ncbi:hypothetical protein LTR05_001272 [Lithohypha guttulata]|uniref:VWFA domain-containing protein n=1 Tax=Lithohypha guttulata TaxID=1690604 RepID=A0AAN7YA81_9EURO|nr:hypothetical protein LTR05_001272 [Lithohypha guttulata]
MHRHTESETEDDGFELLDADLATRLKIDSNFNCDPLDLKIDLQPTGAAGEMLLSISPPRKPYDGREHTSCDIVLVIDISASMNTLAELPDQHDMEQKERSGLSILDLVKHASRTILEKLNDRDRLAVVTFSTTATIVQRLLHMTDAAKAETWQRIEELEVRDCTNLWSGLHEGLKTFEETERIGNVQGMFILTDGIPNHMCPSQGYVKKLQPILDGLQTEDCAAPTISTFGFGYNLRSALMRSIAEVGRGYYAFIPDAGMIATVFVHAVANLFSTFAASAEVLLECSNPRASVVLPPYLKFDQDQLIGTKRTLQLGPLRYGHPRNIIMKIDIARPKDHLNATLRCHVGGDATYTKTATGHFKYPTKLHPTTIDYHVSRHELCVFLASLQSTNLNDEYVTLTPAAVPARAPALKTLISSIESRLANAQPDNESDTDNLTALLADLKTSDPPNSHNGGQISHAMNTESSTSRRPSSLDTSSLAHFRPHGYQSTYYSRWGIHYLPSILHAHMRQTCTSFKDPGPLRYGINSPLFIKCRDELDAAFDNLPAPKPSLTRYSHSFRSHSPTSNTYFDTSTIRMSRFNSVSNPCFTGDCHIRMASHEDNAAGMTVEQLRVGDFVWTPAGGRMVRAIVKTNVKGQQMCKIGGDGTELLITPWHPIWWNGNWMFPYDICQAGNGKTETTLDDCIYSIMLEKDDIPDAHMVSIEGVRVVTLGHGLTNHRQISDVRHHSFFGDHDLIEKSLSRLERDESGRRISGGIVKKEESSYGKAGYRFVTSEEAAVIRTQAAEVKMKSRL